MNKDEYIKIRISKKDKERLKNLSNKENESLSSFIIKKSLSQETVSSHSSPNITPPEIYLINFVNEIYHEVNRSDNKKLKGKVAAICNTFLLNERLRRK